MINNTRNWG